MTKKDVHSLVEAFAGEGVEITTRVTLNTGEPTEDNPAAIIPLIIQGFFLDCDGMFVYISDDGENIDHAIRLSDVIHIGRIKQVDEYDEALEIDPPESDKGYN